jgi:transposase
MYQITVGIDVSKGWIDASWTSGSEIHYLGRFENTIADFKRMCKGLKKASGVNKSEWFVCFDNTGSYSKLLLQWLCSQQIVCREEDPTLIVQQAGRRRGKNDKADSELICRYAYRNRGHLEPSKLTAPVIQELKKLLSRRDFLVRHRSARKASLKEQKAEFSPDLYAIFEAQDEAAIESYSRDIEFIESRIEELIQSSQEIKQNEALLKSVVGIGPVTAWFMIAYTQNFKNFRTSRQFATYCGVAPFPWSSGSSSKGKNRVSHKANKRIKAVLSNGMEAAIVHDPQIRAFYARKINEGKETGCVKNAVKNKLIHRAFAVVSRGTPYVVLRNYA